MIPHAMSWEVIVSMHLTSSSPQLPDWRERSKKRHASQAPWRGMEFVFANFTIQHSMTAPYCTWICESVWAECLVLSYSELEGTFHSPYTDNYANYINMNHEVMICSRAFDDVLVQNGVLPCWSHRVVALHEATACILDKARRQTLNKQLPYSRTLGTIWPLGLRQWHVNCSDSIHRQFTLWLWEAATKACSSRSTFSNLLLGVKSTQAPHYLRVTYNTPIALWMAAADCAKNLWGSCIELFSMCIYQ